MVDDQVDRNVRVHARRIGARAPHRAAHRRQVDDRGDAGEVLPEDASRHERDRERRRRPRGERRDVGVGDVAAPRPTKQVLEEDLEGMRQPLYRADPLLGQPGQPVDVHGARGEREGRAGPSELRGRSRRSGSFRGPPGSPGGRPPSIVGGGRFHPPKTRRAGRRTGDVPQARRNVCDHRRVIDRRRPVPAAVLKCLVAVGLVACHGGAPAAPPTRGTPSALPSFPRGLPTAYPSDLPAGDVPVGDLVPKGNVVTGTWYARTSAGDAIVVAWQRRGADPFRTERGIAVWLHGGDPDSPWRPIDAIGFPANRDLLGLTAAIGDLTGDASDDVLVFAETGGSGGCGIYFAIDLADGARVFDR